VSIFSLVLACGSLSGAPPRVGGDERERLTPEQCVERGGSVVGDIGDGATHLPDYLCPSGEPPVGEIFPVEGQPVAIEGAVCCPKEAKP
jgi:hypothetical protein